MRKLFTSESVTEGHPDKVCDQVSDAILDAIISQDPNARVACETTATTGLVFVMGEITTDTYVSIPDIVREVVLDIGYNSSTMGFDGNTCAVTTSVHEQSADISAGVSRSFETRENADSSQETGAGDQGMMFGYACNETKELMPMAIALAHRLTRRMTEVRKAGLCSWMRPDGKSQVTVVYEDGKPIGIDNIVISTQHDEYVKQEEIQKDMIEHVIKAVIPQELFMENTRFLINPSGRFVLGGPAGDSGLTGRKIIVDTYGGYAPHGGGCFSGKDPTKMDRSACYMARYIAKNIVASGLAQKCQISIAYAIGVAHPVSFTVDTFGTGKISDEAIENAVLSLVGLTPDQIIAKLDLRKPIYRQTASYGHFGRIDIDLPWEKTDLAVSLQQAVL
ncbi:MAG: methionine adenosyltransferase [Clostridiales bacterium]|nr:methionine adenosyltransferase [Clostridiales bacterium]